MNQNLIIDLTPETLSKNQNEFKRFLAVIQSMESYGPDTLKEASKMEKDFEIINSKYPYPKYPFNYKERITRLKQAIELNQSFLNELIKIYKPPPSYYVGIDFDEIKHSRFDEQKFIINILIYTMRDWAKKRAGQLTYRYIVSCGLIAGLSYTEMADMLPGFILDCYIRRRNYDDQMHGIKRGEENCPTQA